MSREWKPGDVLTNDSGALFFVVDHAPVDRGHVLYTEPSVVDADGNGWKRALLDSSARPLAVIDPESREQVERLAEAVLAEGSGYRIDKAIIVVGLTKALREYADPRPTEPTGLGAVVEDAEGVRWVRRSTHPARSWSADTGSFQRAADYADIDAVRVISEGVTEDGAR